MGRVRCLSAARSCASSTPTSPRSLRSHPLPPASAGGEGSGWLNGNLAEALLVFPRDVLAGVVLHLARRDQRDDRADQDVARDRVAGAREAEYLLRNPRRGTAGDDRGELITH